MKNRVITIILFAIVFVGSIIGISMCENNHPYEAGKIDYTQITFMGDTIEVPTYQVEDWKRYEVLTQNLQLARLKAECKYGTEESWFGWQYIEEKWFSKAEREEYLSLKKKLQKK